MAAATTWQIGDPVIRSPFGDGLDFHLLMDAQSPGASSFLYVPCASEPGLAIDSIRVDRIAPSAEPLPAIAERLRGGYAQFAMPRPLEFSVVQSSPADAVFGVGFDAHPVIGSYRTWLRYRRTAAGDIAVQTVRKLLPSADAAARIRFLRDRPPDGMVRPVYAPEAMRARRAAAELEAILRDAMQTRRLNVSTDTLAAHLGRASALEHPREWWLLARLLGNQVLAEGETDRFAATARYLELAILGLYDLSDPPARDLLFDTALTLAEMLAYLPTDAPLLRAAGLFDAAAEHWGRRDPDKGQVAAVLRVLLKAIAEGEARIGPSLDADDDADAAVDALMAYGARAAHVARRGTPELARRAALAVDLAQVVKERGLSRGRSVGTDELGQLSVINKAQVQTQMLVHRVTQQDLDATVRLMPEVFGSGEPDRPSLVFLRSLATARRLLMDNRFPWRDRVPVRSTREALTRISIEAALHLALVRSFDTSSLGGPADVFGMQRGVLLQANDVAGTAWHGYAELMIRTADIIAVLHGESEGLVWELSQIVRQGACAKMVLVIAPAQPGAQPSTTRALRQAGYVVPAAMLDEPGFLFFEPSGACESRMELESLWNGALASALVKRARALA